MNAEATPNPEKPRAPQATVDDYSGTPFADSVIRHPGRSLGVGFRFGNALHGVRGLLPCWVVGAPLSSKDILYG